ncbi:MAG: nucleotidyltransferase domain-containing protein [Methanoregulaceae archaeon]
MFRRKTCEEVLAALRSLRNDLVSRYFVKKIGVFGSVSRGDQTEGSDIDILAEFSQPVGFFLFLE